MAAAGGKPVESGPGKVILALDGGGVRGVISIAILQRIERLLKERVSPDAKLSDHFDLIGGTSTGAIIATALALGFSTSEIKDFYFELAPRVFRRRFSRIAFLRPRFDAAALRREILGVVGDRRLDTPDLRTALAIVAKRMDTGGAWLVSNNPRSKFWDDPEDRSYIGNHRFLLADLVRASTAAPYYFEPELIQIAEGAPPGLFIDGGITPHYNPALALLLMATVPAYGFGWPVGVDRLRVVSVGTGARRERMSASSIRLMPAAGLAVQALATMVTDSSDQVLTMMQVLGRSDAPWVINSEIGDLGGVLLPREPLFSFQRYDARLDRAWLGEELGIALTDKDVVALARLDNSAMIPLAYEIGKATAEKFVQPSHLGL